MSLKSWSLQARLVRWASVGSVALACALAIGAVWFVWSELHRELDLLAHEEVEELEANVRGRTFTPSELEQLLGKIAFDHPQYRFTWRIWRPAADAPLTTLGATPSESLPTSADAALAASPTPRTGVRWRTSELAARLVEPGSASAQTSDRLLIGLLLDAGPRRLAAGKGLAAVIAGIVMTAALAVVGAILLARRLAETLRETTERARALDVARGATPLAPDDAPLEVLALAEAFRESLDEQRRLYSRNLLLTAGMAHELRSPLQNMLGEASVALLRERSSDEYRAVLESQLDELRDLRQVVDNLITLTALREPGALDRKERFELGAELELRLAKSIALGSRRRITLELERDGDLLVEGDREALVLAVHNLVDNALRHASDGGRVEVHLHGRDDAVTVAVDDDGPGVPVSERAGLFETFRQSQGDSRRRGGYGLGLALVQAATEAHGGSLSVGDAPLGGARFELTLPRT